MIVVRNAFRLKFGKAKEALKLWKEEGLEIGKRVGYGQSRLLTDLTGPAYTLVLETTFASLAEWEKALRDTFAAAEWGKWYPKFVPLVESSHREVYTVVE